MTISLEIAMMSHLSDVEIEMNIDDKDTKHRAYLRCEFVKILISRLFSGKLTLTHRMTGEPIQFNAGDMAFIYIEENELNEIWTELYKRHEK